jgi:hypothetical protein
MKNFLNKCALLGSCLADCGAALRVWDCFYSLLEGYILWPGIDKLIPWPNIWYIKKYKIY